MNKPKNKWWSVTKFDVGRELANPDYVQWADERIAALEAEVAKFNNALLQPTKQGSALPQICPKCGGSVIFSETRNEYQCQFDLSCGWSGKLLPC